MTISHFRDISKNERRLIFFLSSNQYEFFFSFLVDESKTAVSNGLKWISSTWIKFLIILLREEGNNLFVSRNDPMDMIAR